MIMLMEKISGTFLKCIVLEDSYWKVNIYVRVNVELSKSFTIEVRVKYKYVRFIDGCVKET